MKRIFLAVTVLAIGCGSQDAKQSASTVQPAPTPATPKEPSAPSPVIPPAPPHDETTVAYAIAVSSAQVPACTPTNVSQLVYVLDLKQFQTCNGSAWAAIDITGPAGPQGAAGIGSTGAAGPQGVQGPAGAVTVAPNNEWLDPINGRMWLAGGSGSYAIALAACTAGWRLPTIAEVSMSASHGLNAAPFTHPPEAWVTDSQVVDSRDLVVIATDLIPTGITDGSVHGIYCTK